MVGGQRIGDIALDAALADGALTVKDLRIGQLAGARLALNGTVTGLATQPEANLRYELSAPEGRDLLAAFAGETGIGALGPLDFKGTLGLSASEARIESAGGIAGAEASLAATVGLAADAPFRIEAGIALADPTATAKRFGVALPGDVGALDLRLAGEGTAAAANLTAKFSGLGGGADFAGELADFLAAPRLAGDLSLSHPSLRRLLAPWVPLYRRAKTADPGALAATARLDIDPARTRIEIADGKLGPLDFRAKADLPHAGGAYALALHFDELDIDHILALLPKGSGEDDASGTGPLVPADLDATLRVTAKTARWRGTTFRDLVLPLRAEAGRLHLDEGKLGIPGPGRVRVTAEVEAKDGQPHYALSWSLEAKEGGPLLRLAGAPMPTGDAPLGRLTLSGAATGGPTRLALDAKAGLAGIAAGLTGEIGLAAGAALDTRLTLSSEDPRPALRLAGIAAPPGLGKTDLTLSAKGDLASAELTGTLSLAGGRISLTGNVTDLAGTVGADLALRAEHPKPAVLLPLMGLDYRPARPKRLAPLELATRLELADGRVVARDLTLRLGATALEGEVTIRPAPLDVAVMIRAGRLDLDALRPARAKTSDAVGGHDWVPPSLPENIALSLDLTADRVDWNGERVSNLVARAGLAKGVLRVDSLQASLPGAAKLTIAGRQVAGSKGPRLEGTLDLTAEQPRQLLAWLEVPPPELPKSRLAKLALKGRLVGEAGSLAIEDLVAVLDESRLEGRISATFAGRPRFEADLDLDRLDLDAYLPPAVNKKAKSKAKAKSKREKRKAEAAPGAAIEAALAGLAPLAGFDAAITARAGELTVRGAKLADIEVAAVLEKGELRLDTFRVGALAGARLAGKGRISDLAGKPELALSYDLAAEEGDDLVAFLAPGTKVGEVGALALKGSLSLTSAGVRLKGKGRLGDVSTSLEAAVGLETDAPVAVQAKLGIKNATATAKRFGLALPGEVGRSNSSFPPSAPRPRPG